MKKLFVLLLAIGLQTACATSQNDPNLIVCTPELGKAMCCYLEANEGCCTNPKYMGVAKRYNKDSDKCCASTGTIVAKDASCPGA